MSNTSFYLKSEKEQLTLTKTAPPIPYEYTLFPVNGRAIPVTKIDISNNMVTFFSGNIEYIRYEMGIIQEKTSNGWQTASSYFDNNYPGIRVYKNNLFQSVINDIKSNSVNITQPRTYMLYGYDGEQRAVTIIKQENGYYRFFVEGIGGTDFNEITGLPIRSVNSEGLDLPILTYIIYKYDGYSQVTKEFFDNVYNNINNNTTKPQNDNRISPYRPDLYRDNTTQTYIRDLNLWITHISSNRESRVFSIYKDSSRYNPPNLIFFAKVKQDYPLLINDNSVEEGVLFTIQGNVFKPLYAVYHDYTSRWEPIDKNSPSNIPHEYRIYRRNIFLNFDKSVSLVLTNIEASNMIPIILSSTTNFNRINPTVDKFIISIPNTQSTNRIFVYQSGTNKLVHITDYIPKGTTQNVTIDYSQGINGIKSSVTPVIPLPVPSFGYSTYIDDIGTLRKDWIPERDTKCAPGTLATNVNFAVNKCPVRLIDFDCKNVYQTNDVYNKIWLQEDDWWVYNLQMYLNDESKVWTGGCTRNSTKQLECPANSKISGFKQRGDNTTLTRAGIYCASPIIPKDYNPAISWSKTPKNPIRGGSENYDKTFTYVCRANNNGYWVPGKFKADNNTCYYGYNGSKSTNTNYELASANEPLVWKNKGDETLKKIEAGFNQADGAISYICRFVTDGNLVPGKEVNDKCYVEYGGREISSYTYQLLSRQ